MKLEKAVRASLKELGIKYADGLAGLILAMQPQAEIYKEISKHSMSTLREMLGFSPSKMTRITQRLESCGVIKVTVEKEKHPQGCPAFKKSIKFTREFLDIFFKHLEA
ncbi:TPA: hypothetical protein ACGBPE_004470 [Escherichia coli]